MKIYLEKEKKHLSVDFTGELKDLFSKIDVNPETVLVVRDGELITPDAQLKDTDELKMLSVVSGG